VGKCENGFSHTKVYCTEEEFHLDQHSGMALCFWCWWVDDMDEDAKAKLIGWGLNLPEDNRPKEFRRG